MRDAVRQAGVNVVSFVLRWNPLFSTLKSLTPRARSNIYYVETD